VVSLVLALVTTGLGIWLLTQTHETATRAVDVLAVAAALAVVVLRAKRATALALILLVVVVGDAAWVGANSPTEAWFGSLVSHGAKDSGDVAITFDDGPNDSATLAIARILDSYGAKGTFFEVGKAVDARQAVVEALAADGHLLGNHSYRHDSKGWLDPRYPELARTQRSIQRVIGQCPAFYRPPHGQHTPLLARVVHEHHMTMTGWDVSVGDWKKRAPDVIARMVLREVRPGSVIDLHDGLDGRPTVDRTELVKAMPLILDGLRARGLNPVRLDVLLRRPGYLAAC
jgi:peptidoglycan/xylan/chitin deacetylase (PgdA/CDA1 family)